MELYFVSDNPANTTLLSANGVAHYQISTTSSEDGSRSTNILRPTVSPDDSIVAEIEWKNRAMPTIIRCPLLSGAGQCIGTPGTGIRAFHYLYKRKRFSPTRYFIGDDALEYRWKANKGTGSILTQSKSNTHIASFSWSMVTEGVFAGEKRQTLRIEPCSVDIDLIVLTFTMMEIKHREKNGYVDECHALNNKKPQGDCGVSAEAEANDVDFGEAAGEL